MVHEQVQQVHGQVTRCGAELVAITQDGQQVCKVAPHSDLRGVGPIDRQLQLLEGEKSEERWRGLNDRRGEEPGGQEVVKKQRGVCKEYVK